MTADDGRNIVVIGASAGGLEALDRLVMQLNADLPATLFVVQHLSAGIAGNALVRRVGRHKLPCKFAEDGERFQPAHIYLAPPDQHLLIKARTVLVRRGAPENRYRPAVDPLFRSAAVAHGSRVIGVVLTGLLDDGTAGLMAVKRCGGIAVVQDPADAEYPGMPQSALDNVDVDFSVPLGEMGGLLASLVRESPGDEKAIPGDVSSEAEIAERVLTGVGAVDPLGPQFPCSCPTCGGSLWAIRGGEPHYRCHTGHSFHLETLLESQSEKIEETLWVALRMLEERKNLLKRTGHPRLDEVMEEAQVHIDRLRRMLLDPRSLQVALDRKLV